MLLIFVVSVQKGVFTFDPRFTFYRILRPKITFIDGDEGISLHRGFRLTSLLPMIQPYLEVPHPAVRRKPTQEAV